MRKSEVFGYWKESFSLLKWAEFKLILLASLNNFRRTLIILFKKFWWLWIAWLVFSFGANAAFLSAASFWGMPFLFSFFAGLLNICLLYVSFLTTRTSLEPKSYSYFFSYFSKIFSFLLTICGCMFFSFLLFIAGPIGLLSLGKFFFASTIEPTTVVLNQAKDIIIEFFISPIIILSGFFNLDGTTRDIISSIKRSFLFFLYFLPLILIIQCLMLGLFLSALAMVAHPLNAPLTVIALMHTLCSCYINVVFLFSLATFSIIYTKIKHAHHHLFFE